MNRGRPKGSLYHMEEIDRIGKKKMNRDRQKFLRRNKAEIIYTDFVKSKLRKTERRSGRVLGTEMKTPENLCNNKLLI